MARGEQYSVKILVSLVVLALLVSGCPEKPIDQGALLTARTVGLDALQKGRLGDAEREFKQVIALAPRDPLGYTNLGLTYLQAGRYDDAEAQLDRARKLDPRSPEIALILAKLYSLTNRASDARRVLGELEPDARVLYALAQLERGASGDSAYANRLRQVLGKAPANLAVRLQLTDAMLRLGQIDSTVHALEDVRRLRPEPPREAQPHLAAALAALRSGRTTDARAELDRFLKLIEVTAPYQAALGEVNWTEGPLVGRPVIAFNPQTLITMRGIAPGTSTAVHFTDITAESGLPDLHGPASAIALGDIDGDGEDNLLIAWSEQGHPVARLFALHGGFVNDLSARTPVPLPAGASFATFADYDNDGWLDLFAIGTDGRGYLLKNSSGQKFDDVTKTAGVSDVNGATRGLFVDLDHDGDLDLLLVGDHSLTALRNNLDGSFTRFPDNGLAGAATDAVFGDVDDDGRTDVFITGPTGADALFHNNGARGFTRVAGPIGGPGPAAIGDYDNDGALDLFVAGSGLWHNNGGGVFAPAAKSVTTAATAAFFDYDNDGWLDLIAAGTQGVRLFHNDRGRLTEVSDVLPPELRRDAVSALLISDADGDGDQDLFVADKTGVHLYRNDGGNNHLGMQVQLTALGTGSGKNNSFGIGSRVEVRSGELYQTRVVTSRVTPFGLGAHLKADVLRVDWTNGVPQTIYFPGTDQDVLELEQLKGSCAFLYTWDGKHFRFVTDIMWQSALGMPLGIMGGTGGSVFAPAGASQEYIRIPDEALEARNGRYVLQVTEELWETAYLDQLHLVAVDHPDSVDVLVDERFPPPAGDRTALHLFAVTRPRPPRSAVDGAGVDVLDALRAHDYRYVSNLTPARYQGLTEPHDLILGLDDQAGQAGTLLVLRGWIYPSDASINVAVSQQQRLHSQPPVLEVRNARGQWVKARDIGFPAGKDKTVVVDIAGMFPTRDHHVRLRTNLQVYWDQVYEASGVGSQETGSPKILTPLSANLHFRGFSRMYRRGGRYGPQWFDYDSVSKESPWRPIAGAATRFGDVRPLLDDADDEYVIMVPGDETTVEFGMPAAATPPGFKRTFFLYSDGWIKDSDLNTANGTTVAPLPYHAARAYPYAPGDRYPADSARQRYLRQYNTRIVGRASAQRR